MEGKAPRPHSKLRKTLPASFTALLAQRAQDKRGCREPTLPPAPHVTLKTLHVDLLCAGHHAKC